MKKSSRICGIVLLALLGVRLHAASEARPSAQFEYRLNLLHKHTHERIQIVYRRGDAYIPESVDRLDHFLRDHRTGNVYALDPRLFDLLYDLDIRLGRPNGEIDIVCGYRSAWSNNFLRQTTSGVAVHSLLVQGEAIDISVPGISTARLRDAGLSLHHGGVGFYPKSGFVHVDVGRFRRW